MGGRECYEGAPTDCLTSAVDMKASLSAGIGRLM